MSQQQRFVLDGVPVSYCEGAFTARFDMDSADAEAVSYDDTVVLVVVARMGAPGFRANKDGDLIRVNRFEVRAAKVADDKTGNELAEMFDIDIQQKLPYTPAGVAAASAVTAPIPPPAAPARTAGVVPSSPANGVSTPVGAPVAAAAAVGAGAHEHDAALRDFLGT